MVVARTEWTAVARGDRISRDILSVSPEDWQVDCGALVGVREVSSTPLAKGQMAVPIP